MKKILVIGYFGYITNQLDGQTIKTRNVYELIKSNSQDNVLFYNTEEYRYNKFSIFTMFWNIITCNRLILIPCLNNITYLFPIIFLLSIIFRFKIIHVSVGGWHLKYYPKHKIIQCFSKKILINFIEVNYLSVKLKSELGFKNVSVLHNFRRTNYIPEIKHNSSSSIKLVFMARINKKKGLDVIFDIAKYIENNNLQSNYIIDFYGDIEEKDKKYFFIEVEKYDFIKYKGILSPDKIYITLNKYDVMLLPTHYYTEGFPGTILDSYISGIPVIVSNWMHSKEFVNNNVSGFIHSEYDSKAFFQSIEKLRKDKNLLYKMKKNAYLESNKYKSEKAWEIINNYL